MVTRFRSINPVQLGIVYAVMYGLLALVMALLMMPFFAIMSSIGGENAKNMPAIGLLGGLAILILAPIFYGVIGFIGGVIAALIYNLVASWTGGIEVTLTHVGVTEGVPATV